MIESYGPLRWLAPCGLVLCLLATVAAADGTSPENSVSASPPAVFLVAARQKPRIAEALRLAGVAAETDILDTPNLLRVTIGIGKGFSACGTRNNVKFSLRRDSREVLLLRETGWTGACEANVFDKLAARLAREMPPLTTGENP